MNPSLARLAARVPPIRGRAAATAATVAATAAAGATALWVRRKARRAEHANPPIGRFVEVDGVRLHVVDRGDGPPVVLLPGNAVVVQDFVGAGLIDRLAASHRVVAFDRPGFGWSERPRDRAWTAAAQAALMREALQRLDVGPAVVIGHSWGAMVAAALALDHPEAVRGLVLVAGYYYPGPRLDVPLVAPAAVPVLGDALRYTVSPLVARATLDRVVRLLFAPRPVAPEFWAAAPREMMLRPSQLRADAEDGALMVPSAAALRPRYPTLAMPVRIFAGSGDRIIDPQAHSARLHREVPGSTLTMVTDAGHMVHYEVPDEIAAAVAELWASRPAPDQTGTAATIAA